MMVDKVTIINGKKYRNRVDVLAVTDGGVNILCCLNGWDNRVELPGGGIDKGEDILIAAARETMEESGWICTNYKHADVNSVYSVYSGSDSPWLKGLGFDGEIQYTVVAEAVEFKPNRLYRAEGDGKHFSIHPLNRVIEQIKKDISDFQQGKINSHLYIQAQYRLACITASFPQASLFVNNQTSEVIQKW